MLTFLIIIIALGSIVGAILLLQQSAKKFDLTEKQQQKIKERQQQQLEKDQAEED